MEGGGNRSCGEAAVKLYNTTSAGGTVVMLCCSMEAISYSSMLSVRFLSSSKLVRILTPCLCCEPLLVKLDVAKQRKRLRSCISWCLKPKSKIKVSKWMTGTFNLRTCGMLLASGRHFISYHIWLEYSAVCVHRLFFGGCPHTFGHVVYLKTFKINLEIMSSGKSPVMTHTFLSVKSDMHTVLTVSITVMQPLRLPRSHQCVFLKTEVHSISGTCWNILQ